MYECWQDRWGTLDNVEAMAKVVGMSKCAEIQFEENGAQLTAVEIGRSSRAPLIGKLHHTLLALGIVISTYQVQSRAGGLRERIALERREGGALDGGLSQMAKEALLPLVLGQESLTSLEGDEAPTAEIARLAEPAV